MGTRIDLTGHRFGLLTVTGVLPKAAKGERLKWDCLCDCGSRHTATAQALQKGDVRSCGCLRVKNALANVQANTRHAMTGTKTYRAWSSMKRRCLVPTDPAFADYGGRGITVCDRWIDSFENFLADMGEAPAGLTLERDDVEVGYQPANCRWVSNADQQNNKRNSIRISHAGKTQTVAQWERELGFKRGLIQLRLKRGWSVEQAMQLPFRFGEDK